jgi:hypothetical protein
MKNKIKGIALVILSMIGMTTAYTNCSVRRINMNTASSLIKDSVQAASTSKTPNTGTGTGTDSGTVAKSCLIDPDFSSQPITVPGIPAGDAGDATPADVLINFQSSYAQVIKPEGTTDTHIKLIASSECDTQESTHGGKCPAAVNIDHKLGLNISALCSTDNTASKTCDNLMSVFDQDINLEDPQANQEPIEISTLFPEFYITDTNITVDSEGAASPAILHTYSLSAGSPGHIIIKKIAGDLTNGQAFTIQLTDVVLKAAEDDTTITVSGTYSGKIVDPVKECTP